ncbi:MAG TPA: response regulator transcription factor, partial [Chitinophagales bacterium]|nr:response regulator transcription factor [Chitinophagales bacterium]
FDDNKRFRESLGLLFETNPGFDLVGSFPDVLTVIEDIDESVPDVVLMDIDMPSINGISAVKKIREKFPTLPVIMLTTFDEDDKVFQSVCAGAMGYLLKNTQPANLIEAIREVKNGGAPMTPSIARKVMLHFQQQNSPSPKSDYNLSEREKEVLGFLVKGLSLKQIGDQLFVSRETVKSHIKNIYSKLHVNCAAEAVAKTLQHKLLG